MKSDGLCLKNGLPEETAFQFICPTGKRTKSLGAGKTSFHGRTKASDFSFSSSPLKLRRFHAAGLVLVFDRDHWQSTDSVLTVCISAEGLGLENIRPSAKSAYVLHGRKRMWQNVYLRSRTEISNS